MVCIFWILGRLAHLDKGLVQGQWGMVLERQCGNTFGWWEGFMKMYPVDSG